MSGVVANGVFYNTESGLSPALDRMAAILDRDAQSRQQLEGLAPAMRSMGMPVPQQGGPLSMLGLNGQSGGPLAMLGIGGSQGGGGILSSIFGGAAPSQPATAPGPLASASTDVRGGAPNPVQAQVPNVPPTGAGAASSPSPLAGIEAMFGKAQQAYGVPAGYLPQLAALESKFNPSAVSPTGAKGLFQFTGDTAKRYGLADPTNVPDSVDKVGQLTRDNAAALRQSLGRDPTPGELYLAHQQGAAGAAALLKNPSLPAGQVLASIGADPNNVAVNGGNVNMPAGAFASKWTSRFGGGGVGTPALGGVDARPTSGSTADQPATSTGLNLPGGMTKEDLGAMIANPASRQIGLQLWGQALTGKNYGFTAGPDGTIIRTDPRTGQAVAVFQPPSKQGFQQMNGRLVATDPQTGGARDVTPAAMPQGFRPATPQERSAYNAQPGSPLFIGPDGKPGTLNSGTNVTVNNATNPILEGLGKQFVGQRGEADSAAKSLPMIQTARTQLQSGIFAGAGANQVLGLQKLGVAFGLPGVDAARITNTETFSAAVKPLVMQLVKNLGSGSGITDADVRFVNQAVGGDTTLEPKSLARILDITERSARNKITDYNTLADQMMKTPGGEAYRHIGPMMHVQMPAAAPSGTSKTIGGTTYTQGADGHWYTGQ